MFTVTLWTDSAGGGGSSSGWVSRPPEATPEAIVLVTSGAESDAGRRRVCRAVPRKGIARTAGASSRGRDACGVARAETRRVVADVTRMSACEADDSRQSLFRE